LQSGGKLKMNYTRFFRKYVLLPVVFLSACTTVKDFQNMTADQRAEKVCKNQRAFQELTQQKQGLENGISDSQAALARGYRIHRQCQKVKVIGDSTKTTCSFVGNKTTCEQTAPASYENRCTETPISLNFELEKSNVSTWQQALQSTDEKLKAEWQRCYQFMYGLPPEEAYKYFVSRG
jgi:hypothetical protein